MVGYGANFMKLETRSCNYTVITAVITGCKLQFLITDNPYTGHCVAALYLSVDIYARFIGGNFVSRFCEGA